MGKKISNKYKLNEEFKDKLVVLEKLMDMYIVNDNVLKLAGIDENIGSWNLILLKDHRPTGVLIDGPIALLIKFYLKDIERKKLMH